MDHMSPESLSRNLVFIFEKRIIDDFIFKDITDKLELVYDNISVETGTSSLANFRSIFTVTDPNVQIIAQENKLIIVDNSILKSETDPDVNFSKLAHNIVKLFKEKSYSLLSYGFNFTYIYKLEDTNSLKQKIITKYLRSGVVDDGIDLDFLLPTIGYKIDDTKFMIGYSTQLDNYNNPTIISANFNVSYSDSSHLSDADSLNTLFKEQYINSKSQIIS